MPSTVVPLKKDQARSRTDLMHDMRTPLAAIRGQVELLRDRLANGSADRADFAEGLQDIDVAAARLGRLLGELAGCHVPGAEASPELSQRELDVLQLVARGRSNKRIARDLTIAENTVKSHVSSILGKLGVESRTQAALYAGQFVLFAAEEPKAGGPFAA